jgi:outer membrane protein
MKMWYKYILIVSFSGFTLLPHPAVSQGSLLNEPKAGDSLSFEETVRLMLTTHPAVMKAQEAVKMSEAGVGLAHTNRLPDVDVTAGYTFLGPLPSITIPDMGTFRMGTPNNLNSSLNFRETLYDFSRTKNNVKVQESSREMAVAGLELVRQQLIMAAAANFYTLVYFQEALKIKNMQIETLRKHSDYVVKKQETGSATPYEVLSTKVRISAAESQRTDIETARKNSLSSLNSLLGLPAGNMLTVKSGQGLFAGSDDRNQLTDFAFDHRIEMAIAGLKEKNSRLKLDMIKVQNRPLLSINASTGFRNGYFPEVNRIKANYLAGLSLKIPLYDASRQKYQEWMAGNEINMAAQGREQIRRDISTEVFQNYENLQSSFVKISQTELQVMQAEEARKLAEVSYQAGTITNLDLLDAETLEAESRLALLRARTEYIVNQIKLKLSLGKNPVEGENSSVR